MAGLPLHPTLVEVPAAPRICMNVPSAPARRGFSTSGQLLTIGFEEEGLHTIAVHHCNTARDYSPLVPPHTCSAFLKQFNCNRYLKKFVFLINSKNILKLLGNLLSKMEDVY